ncbi:MAG: PAP/fibrillin family protein [Polymorphobacter sp.]
MTDIAPIKAELLAAIACARPDGSYDDADFDRIHAAIAALTPLTPTPDCLVAQDFVASPWRSLYSQFGPRHTAGKPTRHQTTMNLQSFNKFPAVDMFVHDIDQEIRVADAHYNNVVSIQTLDGAHKAEMIVWGTYSIDAATPQRYSVNFYAVELRPPAGVSEADVRAQFGLPADHPLKSELKPMKLHSDVVYCDDNMRINFGSMGGVYVLKRLKTPGKSVAFG